MAQAQAFRVRFGEFEIDLRSGELCLIATEDGDGKVVLLREQSLQILRMLVESRGEIVTREEIKRTLWPDDAVVDFDHSINTTIKVLRRALGDSADNPRYIQTLARRGYRLMVASEWPETNGLSGSRVEANAILKPGSRLHKWLVLAALLVVAAAGFWMYWENGNRATLSADDTIVVADVTNLSADPVFDDAIRTPLLISLEQTPYLNVLAPDKVSGTLKLLNIPVDAKITPDIARRVCLRTNSKLIIAGSIADAGNHFRLELNALSCKNGDLIARVRKDVARRNEIVHMVGVSTAQLRGRLGEPASSLAKFDKALEQATSPSPEAVQQLAVGYKRHLALDLKSAIQHYQHATELDPDFGLAYAALGAAQSALSDYASAAAAEKKAYELRTRMTDQTRFQVEDLYYENVTGEQEKAYPVLLQWVQTFPRDVIGHNNLAKCLNALGQPDRDADEAREAARLLPTPWSYRNWMFVSIMANRLEEAKAVYDEAEARKFDGPDFHEARILVAFLEKDDSTMQAQWNWAAGKPMEDRFLFGRSSVEAYHGHFAEARHLRERAIRLAAKSNDPSGNVAFDYAEQALDEAAIGNSAEAQRSAITALASSPNRNAKLVMALALARAGDLGRAQKLADALDQEAPLDTVIQNYNLPAIRAAMKLHEKDPAQAIEILRPTVKYDLAFPTGFNSLYPAYLRGLAYLQMGEGRNAAAEFQKLLDHPGIVGREITGALSHLQLARAQNVMGDRAAARRSYEDFLVLWKNADSDIPVYQHAKAEYARLR